MLDTMWHFMEMGGLKANYPALKEACMEMRQMIMQKTAGQRKDRPKDIPWENWERVKVTIVCEAMALVLSGEYEQKEESKSERKLELGGTRVMEKNCSTCAWHDSFSWVCFNGLSEHRADFTDPENTCQEWKERKDEND